jgi:hypothetical protein
MRYYEIGQVFKMGSKWGTTVDDKTWRARKIAIALVVGNHSIKAAEDECEQETREQEAESVAMRLDEWLGKWPKGTRLQHVKLGYVGPIVSGHRKKKGIRYGISVMGGKAIVCGWESDFVAVKED